MRKILQSHKDFQIQTLQYNYRDDSWAIHYETYTTYGTFKPLTGFTWATVGFTYPLWESWNTPWNSGSSLHFFNHKSLEEINKVLFARQMALKKETRYIFRIYLEGQLLVLITT